jgi:hypothetical protein
MKVFSRGNRISIQICQKAVSYQRPTLLPKRRGDGTVAKGNFAINEG